MIKYYLTKMVLLLFFVLIYIPIMPFLFVFLMLSMIADFLEMIIKYYDRKMAFKWLKKMTDNHNREKINLHRNK